MTSPQLLSLGGEALHFTAIQPGEFSMGSGSGFPLELPVHRVVIERPFLFGTYPVTQQQWLTIFPDHVFEFSSEINLPADSVSWDEATEFCNRVSQILGRLVRLPSEAEWEFCCRAGNTTEFFFGESAAEADDYGWHEDNAGDQTRPVGKKAPNLWGLYDMAGNVWEWCSDVWHSDYATAPINGLPNIADDVIQPRRCLRGGAFDMDRFRMRSAYRSFDWRNYCGASFGLRLVAEN